MDSFEESDMAGLLIGAIGGFRAEVRSEGQLQPVKEAGMSMLPKRSIRWGKGRSGPGCQLVL